MTDKPPYKASGMWASDCEKYYVDGPGLTGYYGHKYVQNDEASVSKDESERIARLMNKAFKEGVKSQARKMRKLLLIED